MILPRLLVLTDRTQCSGPLTDVVRAAVDAGARGVVLREKDLPYAERARLADALRAVLDPVGGVLVVADGPGDAVHLSSSEPMPSRRPAVVGRSCHDALELARAAGEGCDYVTLSPVFVSASKPGYGPALGLAGFAGLVAAYAGPPPYALGGVLPAQIAGCLAAGAHGVAVMGAVMRQPRLVSRYLDALSEVAV